MERGYSILLGKNINASELDYKDCKKLLIRCPTCREPVFKKVRDVLEASERHYLSHYDGIQSNKDCKYRVFNMNTNASESLGYLEHGQKLIDCVDTLNILIDDDLNKYPSSHAGRKLQRQIMADVFNSRCLAKLVNEFAEWINQNDIFQNREDFNEQVEHYTEGLSNNVQLVFGDGSKNTQKRIAYEFWGEILMPFAAETFRKLFSRAYAVLLSRLIATNDKRKISDEEKLLFDVMRILPKKNQTTGNLILRLLAGHSAEIVYGIEATNLFESLRAHIVEEMIGTLLRLPYENLPQPMQSRDLQQTSVKEILRNPTQSIEKMSPEQIEQIILECVPDSGKIYREKVLKEVTKHLGFTTINRKLRTLINKTLYGQVKKKQLAVDTKSEFVWKRIR